MKLIDLVEAKVKAGVKSDINLDDLLGGVGMDNVPIVQAKNGNRDVEFKRVVSGVRMPNSSI